MQEKTLKIELVRIIKSAIREGFLEELMYRTLEQYQEQIAWLEEHNYSYEVYAEHEGGGLIENTNWPNFEHAVIYMEVNQPDHALHFKLVWGGDNGKIRFDEGI